jgi:hypothetical protein
MQMTWTWTWRIDGMEWNGVKQGKGPDKFKN